MKKMLAKAVALSLVMGGIGFVANDAQAAKKAAKDARVAAQQKRHAEMLAARTAK